MAQRTKLAAVLNGLIRNVDLTVDELVINEVRYGGLAGTLLTKTVLDSLIANSHAAMSDNQSIVAGDGLTGGGSGATVTLNVGAGSGISVAADSVAVDNTVVRTNGANAFTADQSFGGFKATNLADPTSAQDAATKAYVDANVSGLDVKQSVKVATTANITLSGEQTIDGVLTSSSRVLVKNQSTASENGLYLSNSGAWTRTTDADSDSEVTPGLFVFIEEGTVNADTGWVLTTNAPITLGSTSLTFSQFSDTGSISAGAGLLKTGNTIDFQSADTSLTVNADSAQVNVNAAGAIIVSSGLRVQVEASNPSLQISSNELGVKFDPAGALSKVAAGTKVNTDGTSIEISSNNLRIASGAAGAGLGYSAGVLSTNVDDSTIEINSDTLRVKDSGITLAKLASNSVDENKITTSVAGAGLTGGGGSALAVGAGTGITVNANDIAVDYSPSVKISVIAGESFAANTTFAVRYALTGETAGRVYKADKDASSSDKFYVIGVIQPTSALSAGDPTTLIISGEVSQLSNDVAFASGEVGQPLHLLATGAWDALSQITYATNEASVRFGMIKTTTSMLIQPMQLNGIV